MGKLLTIVKVQDQGPPDAPPPPPRYVYYQEGNLRRQYYCLRGCLYGQRTAPKEWFVTLSTWLISQGFVKDPNDPCSFVNPITKVKHVTVVDDVICRGSADATAAYE